MNPGPVTREVATDLLTFLRTLQWLHWTAHWQSNGVGFYGDHTMFERLYTGLTEEIDGLAEKVVGYFGSAQVSLTESVRGVGFLVGRWLGGEPVVTVAHALRAEVDLQEALATAYTRIDESGEMSLGFDDFLMGLAHAHETNMYLLRQASERRTAAAVAPSAEGHFFDRPFSREVREFAESGAKSNDAKVTTTAVVESRGDLSVQAERAAVSESPPTPSEVIEETPGSTQFSALSRYLVQTAEPTEPGVPRSRAEIPKHPDIKRVAMDRKLLDSWSFLPRVASDADLQFVRAAVAKAYRSAWRRAIPAATLRDGVKAPEDTRRGDEHGIEGSVAVIFTEEAGLSQYDNDRFWLALESALKPKGLYYELVDGGTATIWSR